jgi:O-antigen/teichoic acid export membrane protein
MLSSNKAIKGTIVLTISQVTIFVCRFIRNIIIARILTKEDYGIAATFALTVTTIEMVSSFAIDRLVVQSRHGDDPEFVATAHSIEILRGFLMSLLLLSLAFPISYYFKIPDAQWAFLYLAIIPLIRGFAHLDIISMRRKMIFWPTAIVDSAPQIIITLLAWPVTMWLGDYSALLWLLILNYLLTTIGTHILSKQKYYISFNFEYFKKMFVFAWPLFLNSILMFSTLQGDRYFVGAFYSIEQLAEYSIAAIIVFSLQGLIFKILTTVILPVFSKVQDSDSQFLEQYTMCLHSVTIISIVFSVGFILLGNDLIILFYGSKYSGISAILYWVTIVQTFRIWRAVPSTAVLSKSDTRAPLFANLFRSLALIGITYVSYRGFDVYWVAAMGLSDEIPALLFLIFRLSRKHGIPENIHFLPLLLVIFSVITAFLLMNYISMSITFRICLFMMYALFGVLFFEKCRTKLKIYISNFYKYGIHNET